jgi:hypothetical protein
MSLTNLLRFRADVPAITGSNGDIAVKLQLPVGVSAFMRVVMIKLLYSGLFIMTVESQVR